MKPYEERTNEESCFPLQSLPLFRSLRQSSQLIPLHQHARLKPYASPPSNSSLASRLLCPLGVSAALPGRVPFRWSAVAADLRWQHKQGQEEAELDARIGSSEGHAAAWGDAMVRTAGWKSTTLKNKLESCTAVAATNNLLQQVFSLRVLNLHRETSRLQEESLRPATCV